MQMGGAANVPTDYAFPRVAVLVGAMAQLPPEAPGGIGGSSGGSPTPRAIRRGFAKSMESVRFTLPPGSLPEPVYRLTDGSTARRGSYGWGVLRGVAVAQGETGTPNQPARGVHLRAFPPPLTAGSGGTSLGASVHGRARPAPGELERYMREQQLNAGD